MGRTPKNIMLPSLEPVKDEALRRVLEQLFSTLKENHRYYADDLTSTVITIDDGDTTPDVQGGKVFKTNNSGATGITTFDNAFVDQEITIIFGDANTTIATSGNIILDRALTGATNGTVKLVYDGTNWREVSRSNLGLSSPGPIGDVTPGTGAFTALSASGLVTLTGGQIKFPATAVPSEDPNTIDDYEEGYHTATITCSTSGGYTLEGTGDILAYTKIGRVVHLQGYLAVTGEDTPDGALLMSLPFTTAILTEESETFYTSFVLRNHGDAGIENPIIYLLPDRAYVEFQNITDTGSTEVLDHSRVDTEFQVYVDFTYIAE